MPLPAAVRGRLVGLCPLSSAGGVWLAHGPPSRSACSRFAMPCPLPWPRRRHARGTALPLAAAPCCPSRDAPRVRNNRAAPNAADTAIWRAVQPRPSWWFPEPGSCELLACCGWCACAVTAPRRRLRIETSTGTADRQAAARLTRAHTSVPLGPCRLHLRHPATHAAVLWPGGRLRCLAGGRHAACHISAAGGQPHAAATQPSSHTATCLQRALNSGFSSPGLPRALPRPDCAGLWALAQGEAG